MIVDLHETTTSRINSTLVRLRTETGVHMFGRVLTLVIDATDGHVDIEHAITTALNAAREHPCRIIVLAPAHDAGESLSAHIRVADAAHGGEVVVLTPAPVMLEDPDTLIIPLLLPDSPVVAWWPGTAPSSPGATSLGVLAQRRITDSKGDDSPAQTLEACAHGYMAGDTDLAWTRLTRWRALLATALDQSPHTTVRSVSIDGEPENPSLILLAAWLENALDCEAKIVSSPGATGVAGVRLETDEGLISLERTDDHTVVYTTPHGPPHILRLPRRTLNDLLAEELRSLSPDEVYGRVLQSSLKGT